MLEELTLIVTASNRWAIFMRVTLSGKKWATWIQIVHRPEGKPEDLHLGANRRAAQTSEAAAKPLVFLSGLGPMVSAPMVSATRLLP